MKLSSILGWLAAGALLMGCAGESDTLLCVQTDPLEKTLKEQMYFEEQADTAALAKGETATFQFVVRSPFGIKDLRVEATDLSCGDYRIPVSMKAFVGYMKSGRRTPTPSRERLVAASDFFPDELLETETMDVPSLSNQPLWVSFAVPKDAPAGVYTGKVTISGKEHGRRFEVVKPVTARIYNVTLPEQTLWITNWFTLDSVAMRKMNDNRPVKPYSERYWELVTVLAHSMRDHGQNVYLISPIQHCTHSLKDGVYSFDFGNFDRMVELFIKEGGLKRIEGGHLGGRIAGDWLGPMGVQTPINDSTYQLRPIDNDTAKTFITQFIPALVSHLKAKGWDKIYMQHIADEPIAENMDSYKAIAKVVKPLMPDIPVIEANHTREVADIMDVCVPQLNYYGDDYDFYCKQQAGGDEVWFYTCMYPQGNYANRYWELPLIQTRLLHWINFRYGATGYLHWGLNYWYMCKHGEGAAMFAGGGVLPAGDAWIVYPDKGKVNSSIRFEAMRDGIADYELLQLLERMHPGKAKELVGATVFRFDYYDNNVAMFRERRVKMLKMLEE